MLALYAISFAILGVQYSVGDPMDINMIDSNGNDLVGVAGINGNAGTGINGAINLSQLSNSTNTIVAQDELTITNNPVTAGAQIIYTIFQVMTGTHMFNIMISLGVPAIWAGGIVVLYILMASFTIAHYLLNR